MWGRWQLWLSGMKTKQCWQKSTIDFHPPSSVPTKQPDDGVYFKEFPIMAFDIYHDFPRETGGEFPHPSPAWTS